MRAYFHFFLWSFLKFVRIGDDLIEQTNTMKRAILLSFFVLESTLLMATIVNDSIKVTGDSIAYLTLDDTIFLSIGPYQEKVFHHFIAPKQTLYSLSKFYGLTVGELHFYNPELKEEELAPGQPIKIPIPNKSIIRYQIEGFNPNKYIPICYRIKKGDTVFNLAKRVFQMPIDTIMQRNQLTSFNLSPGQILQLGWMSLEGIPETNRKYRGHPIWKKNDTLRRKYNQNLESQEEHIQRGVAFWQKQRKDDSKLYALHRHAPINSIVAVTNPMKNRTVYAKVVGRMPDSVYKDNIVVVVSSTAAKMLGAKDARFYVQVSYTK